MKRSTMRDFVRECTEDGPCLGVKTSSLYAHYLQWCAVKGLTTCVRKSFVGKLRAATGLKPVMTPDGTTIVPNLSIRPVEGVPVARVPLLALRPGLTADDVVALSLVADELARVRTAEGHSAEWDDTYPPGVLDTAGGEYLFHAGYHRRAEFPPGIPSDSWPWSAESWKPKDPMRDATRGCALGIAGIARRLRAGEQPVGG